MHYRFEASGRIYDIAVERQGEQLRAVVDGQSYTLEILDAQPGELSLLFEGRPLIVFWAADGTRKWISEGGCTYRLDRPDSRRSRRSGEAGSEAGVRAPMPAQVRSIQVDPGQAVEKGQTLLLLEAMKMEIRIRSPINGVVTRLLVKASQIVDKDQVLAEIA